MVWLPQGKEQPDYLGKTGQQLASGKEEELQAYLEELKQTMDRMEFWFKTGNTVNEKEEN